MSNNALPICLTRRTFVQVAGSALLPALVSGQDAKKLPVFFGLDFSPYKDGQSPERPTGPIPESQIRERLKTIAPYTTWIRTYGVSGGLEKTGGIAHELGLKAAIGVWLGRNEEANDAQLEAGISCARAGDADMLVVGSETLLRGDLKTPQLCEYLAAARKALPKSVPVTTGDGYAQIAGNPELVENIDLLYYNDYPYWGGVAVGDAVTKLDEHYSELVEQAGEKQVWISEHGWPTGGETMGKAMASEENAASYLEAFLKWSSAKGVKAFLFQSHDEKWKSAHEGERGAHWGVWASDGACKPVYAKIIGVRP